MKIIGIIPARYASSRFLGKPLTIIDGKPMIQHVYEQCLKAKSLSDVIIATDDKRIIQAIESFGGKHVLTSPTHPSGTDRCAEVAEKIEADAFINIQGDEPRIHPEQIDEVADLLKKGAPIATLARSISENEAEDPHVVKVVKDIHQKALYFSRLKIPYQSKQGYLQHVGIYGFQKEILLKITQLEVSTLESSEKLEQLRWLENGYNISVGLTTYKSIAIDIPDDLNKL